MILQIALDTPLRRVFDYLPPAQESSGQKVPPPGVRVVVPFGRQRLIGILVGTASASTLPLSKLKAAHEILDERPVFDPITFELLRWAADYYHHPIGEVYAAALPVSLRSGQPAAASAEHFSLTDQGREELREPSSKRAPQQRALLAWLADRDGATADEVSAAFNPGLLKSLAARGWITAHRADVPDALIPMQMHPGDLALTGAQAQAVDTILALSNFNTHLLYGVTGSGKTEVYLRVIAAAIAGGGQALVLVPEIALTPQLVERFRRRFSAGVAVVHSGLTDSERRDAWRAAHSGAARIVIGTRSAVFTSLPRLSLIVVDEEHDPSYKQHEGFRYSARDRPSCVPAVPMFPLFWAPRRHRSKLWRMPRADATSNTCCRNAPARRNRRECRSSICAGTLRSRGSRHPQCRPSINTSRPADRSSCS